MRANPARALRAEPAPRPSPKRRRTLKVWTAPLPTIVLWDEAGYALPESRLTENRHNATSD